jgi:hypothetical protein
MSIDWESESISAKKLHLRRKLNSCVFTGEIGKNNP